MYYALENKVTLFVKLLSLTLLLSHTLSCRALLFFLLVPVLLLNMENKKIITQNEQDNQIYDFSFAKDNNLELATMMLSTLYTTKESIVKY